LKVARAFLSTSDKDVAARWGGEKRGHSELFRPNPLLQTDAEYARLSTAL
jgi:hypothetical protein